MSRRSNSTRDVISLHDLMIDSHERLNAVFDQLLDALAADSPEIDDLWTALEHGLHTHMEVEERLILPAFARVDRDQAVALLRDHGRIRQQLLELGISLDLHVLRLERSRELIASLREHMSRGEDLLYRWADEHLDDRSLAAARRHLEAT